MLNKPLLVTPFDPASIRQRPGSGRSVFDYVAGGDVIRRVIDSTDNEFGWSVDCMELVTHDGRDIWLVRGSLTVPGLGSRDGVGTHPAEGVDSAKAAETDAFKRAAVKFGVALHLYTEEPVPPPREAIRGSDRDESDELPQRSAGNGSAVRRGNGALTPRGLCTDCHAPVGSPHTTRCRLVGRQA